MVTLKETQNLAKAEELLRLHRIRHLPVLRQGKLVGLVTHRDLLTRGAVHAERPGGAAAVGRGCHDARRGDGARGHAAERTPWR